MIVYSYPSILSQLDDIQGYVVLVYCWPGSVTRPLHRARACDCEAIAAELCQTVSGMDAIPLYISPWESSLRGDRFTDLVRKHRISNG